MSEITKQRSTVWLYPETFKKIDEEVKSDDFKFKNRSEFIEKAIDFYVGYLVQKAAQLISLNIF